MSAIGAITVDIFKGLVNRPAERIGAAVRLGRDHARYRQEGKFADPSQLRTSKFYSSLNDATAAETTYANMKGTSVTIVDGLGSSYANCTILDVDIQAKSECFQAGATKYRVDAVWTVQMGG